MKTGYDVIISPIITENTQGLQQDRDPQGSRGDLRSRCSQGQHRERKRQEEETRKNIRNNFFI